ncbi:receptor-type tyrosine-protein phosphatase C isoform X8 [Pygocentrus nattereri]|uniref:receptor-type tyrosine-protein phosphatase C isoform X8 n=1 Tax=Pygocentrus nattereri TaxID=42514 RepID=UPI0018911B99|nr:receptor-type tyrosine-protein phosphatase C isoform X8 [Pygocentrus nattereri]
MATLLGLRFLILALTGLAVCKESTGQNSTTPPTQQTTIANSSKVTNTSDSASTVSIETTASPSPTARNFSTTDTNTSDSTSTGSNNTAASPSSITPDTTVTNTSDSASTVSIETTASPSPTARNFSTTDTNTSDSTSTGSNNTAASPSSITPDTTDTNTSDSTSTGSNNTADSPSSITPGTTDTNTSDSTSTGSNNTAGSPSSITPDTTVTNTSDSASTVSIKTTASPSPTALTNTSDSASTVSNETTASPSSTARKSSTTDPDTSDSASTVSIETTASPSPTARNFSTTENQTKGPEVSTCVYTITRGKDAFQVKLENIDIKTKTYSVEYIDNFDNSNMTKEFGSNTDLEIKFKDLKLCHNYTVHVIPQCEARGNATFDTELKETDITNMNLKTDKVCFKTKWNLTHWWCIEKNHESCTKKPLTIKHCKGISITLPPAETPNITFMNWMPSRLNWTNKPENCRDLNISCTSNGSRHNFIVESGKNVTEAQLFQKYECKGIFHYRPLACCEENITSEDLVINVTCDVRNVTEFKPSNTSIKAIWNITKENCPMSGFSSEVTCFSGSKTESCTLQPPHKECDVNHLEPYIKYKCTFKAEYDGLSHSETKDVKTLPGRPNISKPEARFISSNAFRVNCTLFKWNGGNGMFHAEIFPASDKGIYKNETCFFIFDNLNYLTTYKVEVYGKNSNGNQSERFPVDYTTNYNDRAVLGFLVFLIILTSIALLFVLYKIYLLKRKQLSDEREMDDLLPTNTLLPVEPISADALVETYKKKIADEGRLFMEEFQSIPRIFSNYTVKEAKKAENQSKNRYVDILPYDYNRVPLSNGGRHDYINASFIEGYKESNKYIAAQGPKEETIGDFWRMTWEQNTSIIVMVTRCEEGNKNKCAQYWPSAERETEIFDDFVVKIKGEENCPDYIIRRLSVMNRKEKTPEREVTHIQFTSWPDHGVPGDPGLLLKLRRRVNSFKNVFSGPIVTHCSAGVGRTGTYICIDAMIESLEAEGRVDIYGYVAKLRRQRCLMVQVEAQYVLIHTALIEYNQFGETEISLTDFHSVVNTLRQKEGNEPSLLEMEFQKIPKFKNWRTSNTASTEENKKKNRNSSVVPYDFNRVLIKLEEDISNGSDAEEDEDYSSDEEDEIPTKYINASYMDGYWCPKGLIAAQGPLSDTVADFLQMLYQHRVKTVVMLSDCTENGQEFCSQYWNDEKKEFGEMVVEVKETDTFPTYIRRSLEIQHTKRKESHTTAQYQFLKWEGNELPPNPCDLIDMMKSIRQNGGYKNSQENRGAPVVTHCNDGSSRSGIFCALWNILDSADTEKLVDVFQVSKHLRKERQGMITSLEQYQFLYAALEVAFPVQNGEVKKSATTPDTVQVINEQTALMSATTEDQEVAESSQQVEQKADAEPTEAAKPTEPTEPMKPAETTMTSESSEQTEKAPSESPTNGPAVSVEV